MDVQFLQSDVDADPSDPFARCNLACVLAARGDHRRAMEQIGIAMTLASGPVAAGCVTSAARQVADEFARLWQLPTNNPLLQLVG